MSGKLSSTIGFERRHNAFNIETEAEFVEFMLQDIPPPPADAAELRAWNSGRHQPLRGLRGCCHPLFQARLMRPLCACDIPQL